MSFKLLGIRPLSKCSIKFTKNLKIEHIYKFYNDYEFTLDSNNVVIEIINNTKIPDNLYNQNKIEINISAIVGKNGSGKSSLIELLTASINQLSKKLSLSKKLKTNAELIYISEENEDNSTDIYCELFYELNNSYYKLSILNEDYELIDLKQNIKIDLDLNTFFYTQIVNYSIYSFNSFEIGEWVDRLFHKNDSYQIPIVITPKRESLENKLAGIIDINNENYLLNQRLLSNVISNPNYNFSNTNKIEFLSIIKKPTKSFLAKNYKGNDKEYNSSEININLYKDLAEKKICIKFNNSNLFIKNHLEILENFKKNFKINNIILPNDLQIKIDIYIIYKIIAICEKYFSYKSFVNQDSDIIDISGFLNKINNNKSHITIKLLQVINFVKYYNRIWKKLLESKYVKINSISELIKGIPIKNYIEILEYLPPPIFECHFISENYSNILNSLSSGEKQLVHFTSNILYHLINLNSVKKDDDIKKYNNINIVLDEIELYFHPQYQKEIIYRLLNDIKILNLNDIKSINIIFITHSPFILSDIPKNNVLFLEKGEQISIQNICTFGANINNIFTNSFFINNGLIGNFSKNIINHIINKIKSDKKINHDSIIKYINLIDEPILRNKLFEMYFDKFPERNTDDKLKIERIKKFAKDLGIENIKFQ